MTENEYPAQNDGETMVAAGNGVPPYEPPLQYGFDDDDLDAVEADENVAYPAAAGAAGGGGGGGGVSDVDVAEMYARMQATEDYQRQQESARVKRKVQGATAAGGLGAVIAAVAPMIDGLNLSDTAEGAIMVGIVILTTFFGGYFTKERSGPPGLSA